MKISFPLTGSEIGGKAGKDVGRGRMSKEFEFFNKTQEEAMKDGLIEKIKDDIVFYKLLKQKFKKEYDSSQKDSRQNQYAYIKLCNCDQVMRQLRVILHYVKRKPRGKIL
jgi:type I site-specific restriction-modification system R (restriction) subunit